MRNAYDPNATDAWAPWEQVDVPAPLRSVAVAIDFGGRLNIIGLSNGDRIYHRVKLGSGTVYTPWVQLPGSVHEIAATKEGGGAGELVLLGADANGNLYRNTSYGLVSFTQNGWLPDPWNGWQPLPVSLGGNPAIATLGNQSTVLGAAASVGVSVSGGIYPYVLVASGLPPGLSVSGSAIVGTPTTAGSYDVSAIAVDSTGERSAAMSFAWNVITISVPNVTGMTAARAASALRAVGLGLPLTAQCRRSQLRQAGRNRDLSESKRRCAGRVGLRRAYCSRSVADGTACVQLMRRTGASARR